MISGFVLKVLAEVGDGGVLGAKLLDVLVDGGLAGRAPLDEDDVPGTVAPM